MIRKKTSLLIGVGNELRGDDALGLVVARAVKRLALHELSVLEHSDDGASLLEVWEGWENVIVVDLFSSGDVPGLLHWLDVHDTRLHRKSFRCSSHAFGVAEAVEMSRQLCLLPPRMVVCGIEGKSFDMGAGLSAPVLGKVPELIERILLKLDVSATHLTGSSPCFSHDDFLHSPEGIEANRTTQDTGT